MAYKFQKGSAKLSGSVTLDSGYDLLGAGTNDLGTSGAPFQAGYFTNVTGATSVSGSRVYAFEVHGDKLYGDGANITGISSDAVDVTASTSNIDYALVFTQGAQTDGGLGLAVQVTGAKFNPAKGELELSNVSIAGVAGTVSGSGALSSGAGLTIAGAANLQAGGITNAGSIAGATTISGSGALSVGAGATFAGAVNLQAGGITNAGSIAGATTISGSGALSVGAGATLAGALNLQDSALQNASTISGSGNANIGGTLAVGNSGFQVDADGDTTVKSLNASSGGITNAGAIAGATTISGSGAISSGAGIILAGTANLQNSGITNAGSIAGATTISGSGALSVGAGATLAGALNLQAGGITNAGSIAGGTTLALSGLASVASISMDDGSTLGPDSVSDLVTFSADGDITVKDGAYDFDIAAHDGTNGLKLGGVLVNASAADLNFTNVASAGTVEASKAVVVDSNKDITGFRSITASANVYANKLFGDGSGISGITSDVVDVSASTATLSYGFVGTEAAQTDGSLGLVVSPNALKFIPNNAQDGAKIVLSGSVGGVHASTLALSDGKAEIKFVGGSGDDSGLSMTYSEGGIDISSSAQGGIVLKGGAEAGVIAHGDGSFIVQSSAEVNKLTVAGSDGDLWTTGSLRVEKFAYVAGAFQVTGAVTAKSTFSGSGAASFGAGATMAGALNMQAGGITNAGSIAGATTISGSGALSVGAGATLAGALNMQNGGVTNAGSLAGVTTIVASSTISGSGALSVGAGATLAGRLSMQGTDIANASAVQGVSGSGLILDVSMGATGGSYLAMKDNLNEAFFIAEGANTYLTFKTTNNDEQIIAGKDFKVGSTSGDGTFFTMNGGIDFGGQKLLTASVNLDEAGESGVYHKQSHYIVSGSSAVTINLPTLENGLSMWFKRHPSMTANVTIAPSGTTNTIDGLNDPVVLETAGASLQLVGSGSKHWYIY